MPTYVFLANLTDQGIREVEDTTRRAQATDETIKRYGGTTRDILWTQGRFDVVMTADAPDDEAASAISLEIGRHGFLRIETLRAYDAAEVDEILRRLG
ncbi:MAG: GYD domain-containing protein [Actinomycetota bacterium]|nr:GYD domain-containing protein [Actinomycetota bacterium]